MDAQPSFMTLAEIAAYVEEHADCLSEQERMEIVDRLDFRASLIGRLLDKLNNINPLKGRPVKYGTPNRSSYTYKFRKAAGYSYP